MYDKKFIKQKIKENLKPLRLLKKVSVKEIAEKANISTTYYHKIENGLSMPSLIIFAKILDVLNIGFYDIFKVPAKKK